MPNTANYNVNLPTDGADQDTWGAENNAAHDAWDAQIWANSLVVGRQKLSSGVVSSPTAQLDITIPATDVPGTSDAWREFELHVTEIEPVSSAALQAFLAFDGVPNFESSDYRYAAAGTIGAVASQVSSNSAAAIALHGGLIITAGGFNPGVAMRIRLPESSGHATVLSWTVDFIDSTAGLDSDFHGRARFGGSGVRATHLRLKFSGSNISTARWALFGVPGL